MIKTHKLLDCNKMIKTHKLLDCNKMIKTHQFLVRKDTTSLSLEWWVLSVYNSFDQLPNKVIKTHQFLEL